LEPDFVANGSGLPAASVSYVMLFNILHSEHPEILLREAHHILAPDGLLAIMHWNYDEKTPRGPSMTIRPRPGECRNWVELSGFMDVSPCIDLPPWHYGFTAEAKHKKASNS
jgi:SAM-dependent methyltransferase